MVFMLLALGAPLRYTRAGEHTAPEGCHWQPIPEIKAHLAVPDGWQFEKVASSDVLIYEVRPAGPGFEGIRARYRLEVRRGTSKADVVDRARSFVESVRAIATEAQPLEEQHIGVLTLYSSFGHLVPTSESSPALTAAVSCAANSRTGTIYTMRFDIPVNELDVVAPLGNHLFRELRLDDEI